MAEELLPASFITPDLLCCHALLLPVFCVRLLVSCKPLISL